MNYIEISVRGTLKKVPSLKVENRTVISLGGWVRFASVHDEIWLEGPTFEDSDAAIKKIRDAKLADLFTFAQKIPELRPKFPHRMEWDNVAAIPLVTFEDWWEKCIPQESRKNVRRSVRRGVTIRDKVPNDAFIRGIVDIYNETPIRQGKRFPKYGQSFEMVKREVLQLSERSLYFGAYHNDELIGFTKIVIVDQVASILSINVKNSYFDKRPTNALIANAVKIAVEREMTHLIYGRFVYGNNTASQLTEFKRRNGFIQIDIPRYYIPLTWRGSLTLRLNAHRGAIGILPAGAIDALVKTRAFLLKKPGIRTLQS